MFGESRLIVTDDEISKLKAIIVHLSKERQVFEDVLTELWAEADRTGWKQPNPLGDNYYPTIRKSGDLQDEIRSAELAMYGLSNYCLSEKFHARSIQIDEG